MYNPDAPNTMQLYAVDYIVGERENVLLVPARDATSAQARAYNRLLDVYGETVYIIDCNVVA